MTKAIKTFRAADVSVIKDAKLRAKAQKLQAKQGGFTLLELLVVVTLLATLATGALVAYEGIGENAVETANANNILSAENSIRNYRAIENEFPNQWDNLANLDGTVDGSNTTITAGTDPSGAVSLLAPDTQAFFGQVALAVPADLTVDSIPRRIAQALEAVGIDELQTLDSNSAFGPESFPNLSFNESAPGVTNPASELELWDEANEQFAVVYANNPIAAAGTYSLSIVPSDTGDGATAGGCTLGTGGETLSNSFDGTAALSSQSLNLINDALDDDGCHLVLALGFGKDVPGTTIDSRVAIGQAPTASTDNVNPANNYARYIALFHLGSADEDGATPTAIQANDILPRARLIGVVDPEGRTLDEAIAGANQQG